MAYEEVSARDLLRHCLATIAYRGGKAMRGAPESFATFHASESSRSPVQILAHLGDLFDWALSMANGKPVWHDSPPLEWPKEADRFFTSLKNLDAFLASDSQIQVSPAQLFQGPLADALNHIGQLAMLRRLAGDPIKAENYFKADIATGRVGQDQPPPKREF
jgi:hypothetical protein